MVHVQFAIGREAQKTLAKLPRKTVEQVIGRIGEVAANPAAPRTDVVKLRGREGYRLRVGRWRVLFEVRQGTLFVLKIGSRGDVYK